MMAIPAPTLKKWLTRSLFFITLFGFIVAWLLITPLGFKVTLHAAKRMLPLEMKVSQAHGRWIGPIDLKHASLQLGDNTIQFAQAHFNWQPRQLLRGRLRINRLAIRDLDIQSNPNQHAQPNTAADDDAEASSGQPSLPLAIEILQSDIRNITIRGYTQATLKISRITLHAVADQHGINGQFGFDAQYPSIHGSAKLAGSLDNYHMNTHVQSDNFDIKAQGQGNRTGTQIKLDQGKLLDGEVAVQTQIRWQPTLEWQVDVAANKIKDILPSGTAHSTINFQLTAKGDANSLDLNMPRLDGEWRGTPLNAKLHFDKHRQQINGQGKIKLATAQIDFNAAIGEKLAIEWQANVPNLYKLTSQAKGALKMRGAISGSKAAPNADIHFTGQHIATKFVSSELTQGNLHLDGNTPTHSYGKLELTNMAYKAFLIDQTQLLFRGGEDSDNYKLNINKDQQHIHLNLTGKLDEQQVWQGRLSHFDIKSPELNWALDDPTPIHLSRDKLSIDPVCIAPQQGKLCLSAQWAPDDGWQLGLIAKQVSGQALAVLLPTEDNLQQVKGQLDADMQFSGKHTQLKQVDGELALKEFSAFIKPANTTFKNGHLQLHGSGDKLTLHAKLKSAQGPLKLDGQVTLGDEIISQLNIQGSNFQTSNSSFLKLAISPHLQLKGHNQDLVFSGNLQIVKARVHKRRFSHVATLPEEITYLHLMNQQSQPLVKLHGAAEIDLGNDTRVNLSGLTGKIVGKLKVKRSIQGNLTANGELSLKEGKYTAHAQDLTISKGELTFLGDSVSNPRLDVVAERTIDLTNQAGEINTDLSAELLTVGVNVSGTVSNNTVKLFSHPLKLSDMTILSYLVTGQAGSSSPTGAYGTMALLALNSFASSNSLTDTVDKTEKLQDTTLLDEFAITQEEDYSDAASESTGTMVTLGKRLTPKLFLKYRFGLSSEDYTLSATYQLTRHYATQLYSKLLGTGINLIYRN